MTRNPELDLTAGCWTLPTALSYYDVFTQLHPDQNPRNIWTVYECGVVDGNGRHCIRLECINPRNGQMMTLFLDPTEPVWLVDSPHILD